MEPVLPIDKLGDVWHWRRACPLREEGRHPDKGQESEHHWGGGGLSGENWTILMEAPALTVTAAQNGGKSCRVQTVQLSHFFHGLGGFVLLSSSSPGQHRMINI